MASKSGIKKKKEPKRPAVVLETDELRELGMILDRLAVQSPDGESLDNCLRSLRGTLKGREALTVALIEALGKRPTEVGFRAFQVLGDLLEGSQNARVLKQAAYRFAQKGFVKPTDKTSRGITLVGKESRHSLAYLLLEDEPCFLVTALVHSPEAPEPLALVAYFRDGFDWLHLDVTPSSSKAYREFVAKTSRSAEAPLCEIPIWHAVRLVYEMMDWSLDKRPALGGTVKRILEPFREPERKPYAYEVLGDVEAGGAVPTDQDVAVVFDTLPVRWVLFSEEEMKPWREAVVAAETSVLVVSEDLRFERVEGLIRKAADALCVGRKRDFLQRFLEEGALWLQGTRRQEAGASVWRLARHLARGGECGSNPLVYQLVLESMRRYWPGDFETDSRQKEDRRDSSAFYEVTDSGLIIPR